MMIGGIIMASWGGFKNKIHTMTLASVFIGLGTFALGVIPNFWMYLITMCFVGITMPIFNTPSMVLLQEKVEENYLGRVFGVMSMIFSVTMPLGMLVFGPIADIIKIEWLLIGTGILLLIEGLLLIANKVLIEAGS